MEYLDVLPPGNFLIKFSPMMGYYFEKIEDFKLEPKIYGNTNKHAARILNTFNQRPNSTGVLLSGEKGSGKTLLAKTIAIKAATEQGIPTVTINTALSGDDFNQFISEIKQPMILLFDEFEKVYDHEKQDEILTLLDGVFSSKKLFIMTCNEVHRINDYMRNRPGRIFYAINYEGLEQSFIREYCEDNLINKQHVDSVCRTAILFNRFNFDILKALVEEMNRYNEPAREALEMLNAKPYGSRNEYLVKLEVNGVNIPTKLLYPEQYEVLPLELDSVNVSIEGYLGGDDDDEDDVKGKPSPYAHIKHLSGNEYRFTDEDLISSDLIRGKFVYAKDDAVMTVTRKVAEKRDFRRHIDAE
jgi:hypothetical protein